LAEAHSHTENPALNCCSIVKPANHLSAVLGTKRFAEGVTRSFASWLLTGQLVFTAETAMNMLLNHAHTVPTPPSARSELPIPPALDQLVLSCLAKNPADRPQSAKERNRAPAQVDITRLT
jgi:serine/threonine-protein kinase